MNENSARVNAKAEWLNRTYPPGEWRPIAGFHAITSFIFTPTGPVFNPMVGYPVKAFVNTQTGEIKTFSANQFTLS